MALISEKLVEYEEAIRTVIQQFETAYGRGNPVRLRWQGTIPRVGTLPDQSEYSVHGNGCTVEKHGRIISFDIDENDHYFYTAFKFGLFLGDDAPDTSLLAEEFYQLLATGELVNIPGSGVRLASLPKPLS